MRVHVVANPTAGRGSIGPLVESLRERLTAAGATVTLHWTRGPGDAREHVAGLDAASLDRLVIVGGDGTLNEAVNSREVPLPWPVAIVPLGTANLVARDARVPLRASVDRHVATVLEGAPWTVDLLDSDRGRALAVAGVGLDAEVVRAVATARKGGPGGYLRWIMPIAKTFAAYDPPRLEVIVDGARRIEGGAVIVQNTYCYGGLFALSRQARMDDGRLEVMVLRRANRRNYFRMLLGAYLGTLGRDVEISFDSGTQVEIRSRSPVAVQLDGDPAGTTPITLRVIPAGLRLLRPVAVATAKA